MSTMTTRRGVSGIQSAFEAARRENRAALITYLTLGYPAPADSLDLVSALQAGGADIIELGVPFSDPVADGPTIQRASQMALEAGVTPRLCLELAAGLRENDVTAPFVFMGYYNPIYSYGLDAYVRDCAAAGVNGLIVPDLPPEEAGPLSAACQTHGLALIFLVAPNTDEARMAQIANATRGFLYLVSRLGITGTVRRPDEELDARLALARRYARTPIAVGFGISRPEQVDALAPQVDGIIVGSGVVESALAGPSALREYVASLREATRGVTQAPGRA